MKLKVKGRYSNPPLNVAYDAGKVIEVDERLAAILLADSPESFEVVADDPEPPGKATKRVAKV